MPDAVATSPATSTPHALRATCRRATPAYDGRGSLVRGVGVGRRHRRRSPPDPPTSSANAADVPATRALSATSRPSVESEAQAAKENTRNRGPGGCHSWASETSDPNPATRAATGMASQARCGDIPTTVPSVTEAVSSRPRVTCIRARDRDPCARP